MKKIRSVLLVGVGVVLGFIFMGYIMQSMTECSDRGGVLMRSMSGFYECVQRK